MNKNAKKQQSNIQSVGVITIGLDIGYGVVKVVTDSVSLAFPSVMGHAHGNRNAELFAAACQMRDAGYSQSDAERELMGRYVADGNGSESPASREKEARATIASAYRQAPREPIQTAKERVSALVGRANERPTTAQIVEVVEACVHLNAVEWAEERQRLKALCGDGLKIGDIDRLYLI